MGDPKLLLFDMDGTLVTMWGVHEKAYEAMFRELYGVHEVNFRDHYTPGDSNENVVRSNLTALGYNKEFIESRIGEVVPTLTRYYSQNINPEDIEVLPGVKELLERLKNADGVVTGVVTGNSVPTARMILKGAGLLGYFPLIVGGDEVKGRELELIAAIKKAEKINSVQYVPRNVYYFDDSYASIPVSRKLGLTSVAVATGETSYEKLAGAKPDYLLNDLSKTESVLKIIEGKRKLKRSKAK